ncbi:multisubunit Na+/H+ antiporter MnhG subunit [Elusimicrobium simillimum]|uniref:hypothetical protein n=1 Tax=Elusimicrobium simillimum TaxID=3143438 RepID=UPI003C6EBD55
MNKIIGYFLVCVGLLMFFFATIAMFKVFVEGQAPIKVVAPVQMSVTTQYGPMTVDAGSMTGVLNLVLHALFMFFLAAVGGRLVSGGIGFIRTEIIGESIAKYGIKEIKKL